MSIGNTVKIDRAWKLAQDKALTSVTKEYFEEEQPSGRIVHAGDVWKQNIPSDPAQAVTANVAQHYSELVLEEDVTVAGKKAWIARSGGTRLTDWISPRFGQGFTIQLFDQAGNRIYTTDPCNWVFDYKAGILFLENSHQSATGFKISGYRYIGSKGVGGDPQDIQQVYDAGTKDGVVVLDVNGSLEIRAADNTTLLQIDATDKRVTLRDPIIEGTAIKIETVDTEVHDNILTLNKQASGQTPPSSFISGVEIDRGGTNSKPTIRWNNQSKKWEVSLDDATFHDLVIADQLPDSVARKYVESVSVPTMSVAITNVGEKVNVPGCTLQIYEMATGQLEEVDAEIRWSPDWGTVNVNFEEPFQGVIVITG